MLIWQLSNSEKVEHFLISFSIILETTDFFLEFHHTVLSEFQRRPKPGDLFGSESMAKHEDLPVPVFSALEPVYGGGSQLEEAQLRFDGLKSKFVEVFGQAPDIFARSPGR